MRKVQSDGKENRRSRSNGIDRTDRTVSDSLWTIIWMDIINKNQNKNIKTGWHFHYVDTNKIMYIRCTGTGTQNYSGRHRILCKPSSNSILKISTKPIKQVQVSMQANHKMWLKWMPEFQPSLANTELVVAGDLLTAAGFAEWRARFRRWRMVGGRAVTAHLNSIITTQIKENINFNLVA